MAIKTLVIQANYQQSTTTRTILDTLPSGWIVSVQATGDVNAVGGGTPARGVVYAQVDLCVAQPDGSCLPKANLWSGYVSPFPSGGVSLLAMRIEQGTCFSVTTRANAAGPVGATPLEIKIQISDEDPGTLSSAGVFWEPPVSPAPAALPG